MFRYYLRQRPPMPGAFPHSRSAVNIVGFDERKEIPNVGPAWGYVEYESALPMKEVRNYELREAGPFYVNRETGEMVSRQTMLAQFREEYDGDDPTNGIGYEEYFEEVTDDGR